MEAGLLLLLMMMMMMGVFQAVETFCDGRQDGAQCVGALGGAVDIQLVDNAAEIPGLYWIKDGPIIVLWRSKYNSTIIKDNRFTFIPSTGTVRINNLIRHDSGHYELGTLDSNGRFTAERTLLLSVEGKQLFRPFEVNLKLQICTFSSILVNQIKKQPSSYNNIHSSHDSLSWCVVCPAGL
nr:uncharacterized protein LOC129162833 isoform X1 [Nothobranchius furzeri]